MGSHQLATHDIFAAFLAASAPALQEGLAVWIPERVCGRLFGGFLRPDAVAGVRVGERALTLFIERDLGTERGEGLAQKIRRYDSIFASITSEGVKVGFVTESARRGMRLVDAAARQYGSSGPFLTVTSEDVLADPLGARWFDGDTERSARELATSSVPDDWLILGPSCLVDADAIEALDDRGAAMLPALRSYATSPQESGNG